MSSGWVKGEAVFFCDAEDCGETLESGVDDFALANALRKAEGWTAFKNEDTGEWEHRCPGCKGRN